MSIILGSRVQVCLEKNIGYFIVYQHFEAQYMQLDKAPSHVPISAHGSRKYRVFLTLFIKSSVFRVWNVFSRKWLNFLRDCLWFSTF